MLIEYITNYMDYITIFVAYKYSAIIFFLNTKIIRKWQK